VRWLLLKDLQILKRSPLLVALLVVYPVAIALLIGFALSRGPAKPKVAFLNLVPPSANVIDVGGEKLDASKYAYELFKSIKPVRVRTRAEALGKVRSGDAIAALIIPADVTEKLASGLQSAHVEVFYNNEDPVKGRFVEQTISARLAEANEALADKFKTIAVQDIKLLQNGGDIDILGRSLSILGLKKTKAILDGALATLPRGSPNRPALKRVSDFAGLAIDNLNLSNDVLGTVSRPVVIERKTLRGKRTPLDSFAVAISATISLMFVTILLAAGMLALEREENAFTRLVRGLVSRLGLLLEKIGLAAVCAFGVALAMLVGIGAFVSLDWGRFPLWLLALAAGAVAFGALGVAIGGVAREVRAASLLAFLLSLPIAFLALVPSGAVSKGVFDVIRVVSALFPFKAALELTNNALNDTGRSMWVPLAHLAVLTLGFTAIGRLALRRFG
jgi:ABC-type multidrug transport system permease subunit